MRSKWITHKGVRIFYANLSGFGENVEHFKVEMDVIANMIGQEPHNSVLGLMDIRDTVLSQEITQVLKKGASKVKSHVCKRAIVNNQITGFKKVIISAVGRFIGRTPQLFDDIEKAKDWLVDNK